MVLVCVCVCIFHTWTEDSCETSDNEFSDELITCI